MWKRFVCGLMAFMLLLTFAACGGKKPEPEPVKAVISVNEALAGRDLNAGEFSFELKDSNGKLVSTAANDAAGKVSFDALTYTEAGTYDYTVTEVKGTLEDVTYDDKTIAVTVTVTYDENDNVLSAVVSYPDDITFNNSYEAAPVYINPLTGEQIDDPSLVNRRPVAVMLNNHYDAMPQHGVSQADMIFEYNVEGGITRMVGFFFDPSKVGVIGSIRSARACFVETVLGMDAIYFHCGGSTEADNMMYNLGMDHIDENYDVYWRDYGRYETRAWEHTLMTSGESIANFLDARNFRRDHYDDYSYPIQYVEDGTPKNGETAEHVYVRFSNYKTGEFDYNADTGLYMINEYGSPYIDGNTNEQVGVTNLLVLRTTVYNSGDSSGHMVIDLQGSDSGMYFCGGKCEEITWEKDSMYDPFVYYHADGTPLDLQVGHTYVCVIAHDAGLSYD